MEIAGTHDAVTHEGSIGRQVISIHTDWKGYNNLGNLGYIHKIVNQQENMVDPSSGAYTRRIESTWSHINKSIKKKKA